MQDNDKYVFIFTFSILSNMAIHPELPGLEVTIRMDGAELHEYPTENNASMPETRDRKVLRHRKRYTVSNYIESVTDSTFTINLRIKAPFKFDSHSLTVYAFADGELIDSFVILKSDYVSNRKSVNI